MSFLSALENGFEVIAQCGVLFLECIGVVVLLSAAVRSIAGCLRKDPHVRLVLAQGIALALEFKLGGEVLRTAIVREPSELVILGAIILLRAALTFLIHWEIKNEEAQVEQELEEIQIKDGAVTLDFRAFEVKTVRLI